MPRAEPGAQRNRELVQRHERGVRPELKPINGAVGGCGAERRRCRDAVRHDAVAEKISMWVFRNKSKSVRAVGVGDSGKEPTSRHRPVTPT